VPGINALVDVFGQCVEVAAIVHRQYRLLTTRAPRGDDLLAMPPTGSTWPVSVNSPRHRDSARDPAFAIQRPQRDRVQLGEGADEQDLE
jgi:hypothetical protein